MAIFMALPLERRRLLRPSGVSRLVVNSQLCTSGVTRPLILVHPCRAPMAGCTVLGTDHGFSESVLMALGTLSFSFLGLSSFPNPCCRQARIYGNLGPIAACRTKVSAKFRMLAICCRQYRLMEPTVLGPYRHCSRRAMAKCWALLIPAVLF